MPSVKVKGTDIPVHATKTNRGRRRISQWRHHIPLKHQQLFPQWQCPRGLTSSTALVWEPQISHCMINLSHEINHCMTNLTAASAYKFAYGRQFHTLWIVFSIPVMTISS